MSYSFEITWQAEGISTVTPDDADIDAAVAAGVDPWDEDRLLVWLRKNRAYLFDDLIEHFDERDAKPAVIQVMTYGHPPEKYWAKS